MGKGYHSMMAVLGLLTVLLTLHVCTCQGNESPRLKLLMYAAADDGSHQMYMLNIARSLIRQGHSVTLLLSSSCTKWLHINDAHLFDFITYQSSYTTVNRQEISRQFSANVLKGNLRSKAEL